MQFPKMTIRVAVLLGIFVAVAANRAAAQRPATKAAMAKRASTGVRTACENSAESFHPGHLLVRFKTGTTRAGRQAAHNTAEIKRVLTAYHIVDGLQLVEVKESKRPTALAAYQAHPDVLYAEPDYIVYPTVIPNDPDFGQLWGLQNNGQTVDGDPGTAGADIRAPEAWDFWTGDPDFVIAVVDTGIDYTHPDLEANIWSNPGEIPGNWVDDDGNGYIDDIHGYDFKNENPDPTDGWYHGTHVAGTIGAVGNNNEGVVGVNWACKIMSLRFMDGNW